MIKENDLSMRGTATANRVKQEIKFKIYLCTLEVSVRESWSHDAVHGEAVFSAPNLYRAESGF